MRPRGLLLTLIAAGLGPGALAVPAGSISSQRGGHQQTNANAQPPTNSLSRIVNNLFARLIPRPPPPPRNPQDHAPSYTDRMHLLHEHRRRMLALHFDNNNNSTNSTTNSTVPFPLTGLITGGTSPPTPTASLLLPSSPSPSLPANTTLPLSLSLPSNITLFPTTTTPVAASIITSTESLIIITITEPEILLPPTSTHTIFVTAAPVTVTPTPSSPSSPSGISQVTITIITITATAQPASPATQTGGNIPESAVVGQTVTITETQTLPSGGSTTFTSVVVIPDSVTAILPAGERKSTSSLSASSAGAVGTGDSGGNANSVEVVIFTLPAPSPEIVTVFSGTTTVTVA
ncbi:hypothetical protein QBC47DRAFT_414147 [Echria macrotheca]|uniref:Uncharacterized protein n=1 Tax=Echria macrotheca TaxID=438768 RepID=A0AAJ0F9D1_9PEZI|nr:hypothetical protein QBC47DRAFT_414147 [Echria macrotheca]